MIDLVGTSSLVELNTLVIGITGHGKSTLSNFIFQENVFQTDLGFVPVTKKEAKRSMTIQGVNFNIIDTVGFSDGPTLQEHHVHQIGNALGNFSGGINAVIFVIKSTERFTIDVSKILTGLQEMSDIWDHCFVVFTNSKGLANTESEQLTIIQQMLSHPSCPESLTSLMKMVNNRYMVVESVSPMGDDYHMNKMNEMIEMIKRLKTEPYTNVMFQIAYSKYKEAKEKAEISEAKLREQQQLLDDQEKQFKEQQERQEREMQEKEKQQKERAEKMKQELRQMQEDINRKIKKRKRKRSLFGTIFQAATLAAPFLP